MMHIFGPMLFWLLLGVGFLLAAGGITWLLVVLSTGGDRGRSGRDEGSRP